MNRPTIKSTTSPRLTRLPALVSQLRDDLATRRAQRAEHRKLEADLATYTTASDLADLHAMLNRYDDAQVEPIRQILARRHAA
jgi:hypothetical protein